MHNLEKKQEDNTIDLLKFILALFVVGIHAGIFNSRDNFAEWFLMHWLFRLAVPFFFVASGYYLGKKLWNTSDEESKIVEVFKSYRRRLYPPLLLWSGIELARQSVQLYRNGVSIYNILLGDIQYAIFYPQGAMWFVWACIIASFIIQVFWKHKKLTLLAIAATIGYFFALICNTYYFAVKGTILDSIIVGYRHYCLSARNGIFVGALFVLEGIMLASDKVQIMFKNMSSRKCWLVLLICELIFVVEICYSFQKPVLDDHSLFIIFPVLIPIIVLLAIRHCVKIKLPYRTLRDLSTSVYFLHRFILNIALIFVSSKYAAFCIVITCSVVIALIVRKINIPFLNQFVR